MAYTVMAFIVMDYIATAYIIMAYIVMACAYFFPVPMTPSSKDVGSSHDSVHSDGAGVGTSADAFFCI